MEEYPQHCLKCGEEQGLRGVAVTIGRRTFYNGNNRYFSEVFFEMGKITASPYTKNWQEYAQHSVGGYTERGREKGTFRVVSIST